MTDESTEPTSHTEQDAGRDAVSLFGFLGAVAAISWVITIGVALTNWTSYNDDRERLGITSPDDFTVAVLVWLVLSLALTSLSLLVGVGNIRRATDADG